MRCAVFFSGMGSTAEALLKQEAKSDYSINLLVTDNPQAEGIIHAYNYSKELLVLTDSLALNNKKWNKLVYENLNGYELDIIVLAGFMRILSADCIKAFKNKIINIHPSLLPCFKGLNTHERVLVSGASKHGFSIHLVTANIDEGPVLAQGRVEVATDDDTASLRRKVQFGEKRYYPQVLHWIAEKRMFWNNNRIYMDNKILSSNGVQL